MFVCEYVCGCGCVIVSICCLTECLWEWGRVFWVYPSLSLDLFKQHLHQCQMMIPRNHQVFGSSVTMDDGFDLRPRTRHRWFDIEQNTNNETRTRRLTEEFGVDFFVFLLLLSDQCLHVRLLTHDRWKKNKSTMMLTSEQDRGQSPATTPLHEGPLSLLTW